MHSDGRREPPAMFMDDIDSNGRVRRPKTEGATPVDIEGADHSCVAQGCTIQTCSAMRERLVSSGRVTEVAPGMFQSNIAYGFDKIDPLVLFEVAAILEVGEEVYGRNAWHGKPPRHHLNHAIAHLYSVLKEDPNDTENHFGNAICRAIFAYGVFLRSKKLDTAAHPS